jgi:hypothetical protein
VRTAELLAQPDVLAADAGALLQLVRCLRDVDYTGHDSLHYLTRHFVLARLMLQPIWHSADARAYPTWEPQSLPEVHGKVSTASIMGNIVRRQSRYPDNHLRPARPAESVHARGTGPRSHVSSRWPSRCRARPTAVSSFSCSVSRSRAMRKCARGSASMIVGLAASAGTPRNVPRGALAERFVSWHRRATLP